MPNITDDSYLHDLRLGRSVSLRPCGSGLVAAGAWPQNIPFEPISSGVVMRVFGMLIFSVSLLWLSSWNSTFNSLESSAGTFAQWIPTASFQAPPPSSPGGRSAVSLATGTEIKGRLRIDGQGELNIKNGTSYDAIVNLVEPHTLQAVRSVYVQAGKTFIEKNIAPGTYEIYFSTGIDWDTTARSFVKDASYGRLERQISYYEAPDLATGQTKYCGFEITLQATEGGGVASLPVDKQTFQLMMDQAGDTAQVKQPSPRINPSSSN